MTYKEYCKSEFGYDVITTYWEDFSIAERFGAKAIVDTYRRALLNTDYKMMTELTMVLNHKIWEWYRKTDLQDFARLYNELWLNCDKRCNETLKGEELQYFLRTTD